MPRVLHAPHPCHTPAPCPTDPCSGAPLRCPTITPCTQAILDEVAQSRTSIETVCAERDALKAERDFERVERDELRSTVATLKAEAAEMRVAGEQVRMMKEALKKMDASQRELKSQLEAERAAKAALELELAEAKRLAAGGGETIQKLENEIVCVRETLDQALGELNIAKTENFSLEDKVRAMVEEFGNLKRRTEQAERQAQAKLERAQAEAARAAEELGEEREVVRKLKVELNSMGSASEQVRP